MNRISVVVIICLAFLISFFSALEICAQKGDFRYYAQINTIASKGNFAPYWFVANNNGISSVDNVNGYARYGMSYDNRFGKSGSWSYNITADVLACFNQYSTISFQQAFADLSWKWLTLSIGSKERWGEQEYSSRHRISQATGINAASSQYPNLFNNRFSNLGVGGLVFSGNSRPIPQIRLEIPEFLSVAGTNDWLKIRAYISYGLFTDGGYQKNFVKINSASKYGENILYHGKAGFISVGNPSKCPVVFDGGLEMHTQFGGNIYRTGYGDVYMPHRFVDFIKDLVPMVEKIHQWMNRRIYLEIKLVVGTQHSQYIQNRWR